jgi:hypothetical protein
VIISVVLLAGCDGTVSGSTGIQDRILTPIAESTRIEVKFTLDRNQSCVIDNPRVVGEAVNFVNGYVAGWSVPFAGPPVGTVYFDFFDGEVYRGNFYVGPSFFGRDKDGFFSRSVTDEEIAALSAIVGFSVLEEPCNR